MNRKRILIVDDERRIRDIYLRLLVESGFIVRQAQDAREAINILIREKMDIVLLDLKMPDVDGAETFDIIKEFDPTQKIIIASVFPLDTQRRLVPAATDFFDKSHGPFILLEKIASVLSQEKEASVTSSMEST